MDTRLSTTIDASMLNSELPLDLDDLMTLLAEAYDVPIALIGIVGKQDEVIKASHGTDIEYIPRENAFCSHVVESGESLLIPDVKKDERFRNTPNVLGDNDIVFYAGTPIHIDEQSVGAVCLIDSQPRNIGEKHLTLLKRIGLLVSKHIGLSREHEMLKREHGLIEKSPIVLATWNFDTSLKLAYISKNAHTVIGADAADLLDGKIEFTDLMCDESDADFTFAMQAHMEGVETHVCRLKMSVPTRTIWVSMISTASFNDNGSLFSVQAFLFDTSDQKYVEDKLNETNQRMRLLLEASELGTWDWNLKADVNQVNRRWCEIVGIDYEYYDTSYRYSRQLIHPADLVQFEQHLDEHLRGKTSVFNTTFRMKHANGNWVWVESYGKIVENDAMGKPLRVAGIHRDITGRMESEIHERKKTQLLQFINKTRASYLESNDLTLACQTVLPELIELSDSQFAFIAQMQDKDSEPKLFIHAISDIVWDSSSFTQYAEYKKRNLYFTNFNNLFGKVVTTGEVIISNTPKTHPASRGTPKGHPRINRFLGLPVKIKDEVVGMIGLANKFEFYKASDAAFFQPFLDALAGLFYAVDLETARAEAEEKLRMLAMTDPLTGLLNRRAFLDECNLISQTHQQAAIAIIDIDYFKSVNDTYGHDAGDYALKEVASLTRSFCSEDGVVARLGGEEFAIVLVNKSPNEVNSIFESLREAINTTQLAYKNDRINITISTGVSYTSDCFDIDFSTYLSVADQALYEAKSSGRNRTCWQPGIL